MKLCNLAIVTTVRSAELRANIASNPHGGGGGVGPSTGSPPPAPKPKPKPAPKPKTDRKKLEGAACLRTCMV